MRKFNLLFLTVVLLVVINLGLVYLCFFNGVKKEVKESDTLHSWLDKNLGLTDQQELLHVGLRNAYFKNLRVMNDTIQSIKARFVAHTASSELSDSLGNFWTDSINRWHRRADELTYRHVLAVRNILEPKQQPILDSLIQVIMLRKPRE